MLKNYIIVAWRHLKRYKIFSLINVLGLAAGITFMLLTAAYIRSQWLVNADIKNSRNVYLLRSQWKNPNIGYEFSTLAPLANALKDNYPTLVKSCYHHDGINSIVSKGEKKFSERLQVGDSSFLSLFGFPLLHGDAGTALRNPGSIVLTAGKAIKYFGKTDVVGQTLTIQSFSGNRQDFTITAVMKDPPENTIMTYGEGTDEFFLPAASLAFFGREQGFQSWTNPYMISYIQLQEGVDPDRLQGPIRQLLKTNAPPDIAASLHVALTPIRDYYLQSNNGAALRMIGSLGLVALFIMIMAIVNFINISIGNSITRLREIGVRQVMGSSKKQLIFQFLTESIVLTALAMFIALLLYAVTRRYFSDMLGQELPALTTLPAYYLLVPVALPMTIGFLAGLYPAFVLSGQDSVASLKGKLAAVKGNSLLRYSLLTLQLVTALIVFTSAIVIHRQVSFFFNTDLGYNKQAVITSRVPRDWTPKGVQHMADIRRQLAALPEVSSATFSYEIPDGGSSGNNITLYRAEQDSTRGINVEAMTTDEKYLDTYQIPLVAGAFFNAKGGTLLPASLVLNQSAVRALGWHTDSEAIGRQVRMQAGTNIFTIRGVAKDFHFGPLQESIRPLFFMHVNDGMIYRFLSFRLRPGNISGNISALQKKWSALMPDAPFEYNFMDDTLARLYASERQMKQASGLATVIALTIVLLGVLGIVMQSIARRTKEVGLRKILGASVIQILLLFAKEFYFTLLIANTIAWPLAWIALRKWLNNYAYRIHLDLLPFLLVSLILAILVALLVTVRTVRTALANPVKNIRTE